MTTTQWIPVIPDNAPFTAAQRSWLNGFFAGMLNGIESNPTASTLAGASPTDNLLAGAVDSAASPVVAEEAFPWHDPGIELPERLKLAEDRPVERRLMAAMAQLNCGQCGYLCKTYAEAVATGAEKKLTLCSPGGKATTKAIKEILAVAPPANEHAAAANGHANGSSNGNTSGKHADINIYSRQNPAGARLVAARPLNGNGSDKDVRHVILDLNGSGLKYNVGDSLGVLPKNCSQLADEVIATFGFDPAAPVVNGSPEPKELRTALVGCYDIQRPSDELVQLLAASATTECDRNALQAIIDGADDDRTIVELAASFPSARPKPDQFVAALAPLQPRLYSISSSLKACPNEVHLTVGVVRYQKNGRAMKGVASTYLAERVEPGGEVAVFVQPAHGFALPEDDKTPIIMVGPGTGIAPFRAFLQERKAAGAKGDAWLFFGDQRKDCDFLYADELSSYQQDGVLTRLDVAFSRDQGEKVYVQHRMLENAGELWNWLERGAHFYVCGDAKRMAADVDRALHQIVAQGKGCSPDEAKNYLRSLAQQKRYQRDVY